MFPLETKQSGGKLLHHSDLRGEGGGVFLEKVSRSRKIAQLPKKIDNLHRIVQNKIKRVGTNALFV